MNCAYHAEVQNVAFCTRCGRPLCSECVRKVKESMYCENCLAEVVSGKTASSTGSPADPKKQELFGTNPGAAFAIGLIPGVGAIYNGEFLKAAIHVLIFGTLASLHNELGFGQGLFGLLAFAFYWYMPFEAYYTAKKRKLRAEGSELETPIDRLQQQFSSVKERELWGGVALVVIGGLLLLGNLDLFNISRMARFFWPLVLVGLGVWLLKRRQGKVV